MFSPDIYEWRGVEGLVVAEVTKDDGTDYVTGTPFEVAGVSEITVNKDQSMDTHFYNNYGAVVVDSIPVDSLAINTSAIPEDIYAKLTGSYYDESTGMLVEGKNDVKYFAVGYRTQDTNGNDHYVWYLKGRFAVGGITHSTKNNSTDAAGQSLTFNAVRTQTAFTKGGTGATSVKVDGSKNLVDFTNFFTSVQTPDTIVPKVSYELTVTTGVGATNPTIKRNGVELEDGDTIYAGDELKITALNSTITVNGVAFTSGDIHVVTGNTTVATTASN